MDSASTWPRSGHVTDVHVEKCSNNLTGTAVTTIIVDRSPEYFTFYRLGNWKPGERSFL